MAFLLELPRGVVARRVGCLPVGVVLTPATTPLPKENITNSLTSDVARDRKGGIDKIASNFKLLSGFIAMIYTSDCYPRR